MILQNSTKGMRIYTLPHDEVCSDDSCLCTKQEHAQTTHDRRSGARGVRMIPLLVPKSIHIPAGGSVEVAESELQCVKIKTDLQAKILVKKES